LKSLGFLSNITAFRYLNNRLWQKLLLKIDYFSTMTPLNKSAATGEVDPAAAS